jgi:hypothetical protein
MANLLGMALAGGAILSCRLRTNRDREAHLIFGGVIVAGIVLLLTVPGRAQLWHALPLLSYAQNDLRVLILVGLPAALLAGAVSLWSWPRPWVMASILAVAVIYGYAFARPMVTQPGDDASFLAFTELMRGTADWDRTVLPRQARLTTQLVVGEPRPLLGSNPNGMLAYEKRSTALRTVVESPIPSAVKLPVFFFPGWRGWVDGTPVDVAAAPADGTLLVPVPPGRHEVIVRFTNTPPRVIGNALSLITAVGLVLSLPVLALWRGRSRAPGSTPSRAARAE